MKKLIVATTASIALASTAFAGEVNVAACAACHGADFGKVAMGVSKVVKDMTHDEIATALKGYKAGTYGGKMKSVMASQVSKYTEAELEAAAQKIGK